MKKTYQEMLSLCAPLILANILQQFYNTVDTWVIGRYTGTKPFAAVGVASSAMNLFLFFIVGLCTGISVVFAQLYGAEKMHDFRQEHFQTLIIGTGSAIVIALTGIALLNPLLHILGTPEELSGYAGTYLGIVLLGLPFSFLYNFYNALLRATENVKAPLVILLGAVIFNIFGDLFLVKTLHMGIAGAAVATVVSQMFSVAASIFYMWKKNRNLCFAKEDMCFSKSLFRRTFSISIVTAVHQASLYIGKLAVQGAVNSAGTDMITAYTATTRIEGFINSFGDSGAAATSVVIAQCYGAGNHQKLKESIQVSFVILSVFGILSAAVMNLSAPFMTSIMLGSHTGIAYDRSVQYLRLISFFYIFCFWGNTCVGFFDGIGKTVFPFIGAASHITLRAILSWKLIGTCGLSAVALACGTGWILANIFWFTVMRVLLNRKKGKYYVSAGA